MARVWQLTHGLIKARLNAGVLTVLDATNLDQEDRLRVLSLLPRGVFARYVILDRDLREKEQTRGWRSMDLRSEEHTSELQSLMRISYAVFCLKKTKITEHNTIRTQSTQ